MDFHENMRKAFSRLFVGESFKNISLSSFFIKSFENCIFFAEAFLNIFLEIHWNFHWTETFSEISAFQSNFFDFHLKNVFNLLLQNSPKSFDEIYLKNQFCGELLTFLKSNFWFFKLFLKMFPSKKIFNEVRFKFNVIYFQLKSFPLKSFIKWYLKLSLKTLFFFVFIFSSARKALSPLKWLNKLFS